MIQQHTGPPNPVETDKLMRHRYEVQCRRVPHQVLQCGFQICSAEMLGK